MSVATCATDSLICRIAERLGSGKATRARVGPRGDVRTLIENARRAPINLRPRELAGAQRDHEYTVLEMGERISGVVADLGVRIGTGHRWPGARGDSPDCSGVGAKCHTNPRLWPARARSLPRRKYMSSPQQINKVQAFGAAMAHR